MECINKVNKKWKLDRRRLALDGSTDIVGWCIFDGMNRIKSGVFRAQSGNIDKRIESIRLFVDMIIKEYNVDEVILEDIQLQYRNRMPQVKVYRALAMVRGVLANVAFQNKCEHYFILPNEWRSILGIKCGGRNDREISKKSAEIFITKFTEEKMEIDEIEAICLGMAFILFNNGNEVK